MQKTLKYKILPVWCAHKRVGRRNDRGGAKISKLYLTRLSQQNITRLHISKHTHRIK